MTLQKKDFTLFMKRLRQIQDRDLKTPAKWPKIKYYAAGEYGEIRFRPHYHIILFNVYDPINIGKAWKQGQIHIGKSVTGASIAYTAKYIDKAKRIPLHANDDRQREYSVMSKYLGSSYYENPAIIKYHKTDPDNRNFVSIGKIKQAMPRYYRKKIFSRKEILSQNRKVEKLAHDEEAEIYKKIEDTDQSFFEYEASLKNGRYQSFYNNSIKREFDV
jgi:hypothetical protein